MYDRNRIACVVYHEVHHPDIDNRKGDTLLIPLLISLVILRGNLYSRLNVPLGDVECTLR